MKLTTNKKESIIDVCFENETLDAGNSDEFKEAIAPVIAEGEKVAFDLRKVSFVDSSGCGALLSCLRKINASDGELKLYGVQKPVRTLFELVRMHRVVDIFNTRKEALGSF